MRVRVGRVVVILPVDLDRDEIVLIRQFRLGAHLALGLGELVEVPAGRVERGEDVADAARRECQEETGVAPQPLVPLFDLMPSAGSSDEHMFFFLGVVDASKVPERAGAAHEQEDTRPLRVPIDRALEALAAGKLHYGAAVLGLQWLALNRGRLRDIACAMSAILVAVDGPQAGEWHDALARRTPRDARCASGRMRSAMPADIAYACVWLAPHGLLAGLPNLKAIINLGAGVDHLLADPSLPSVPVARVAHPDLTARVTEYVVLHVLMHHRRQRLYDAQQRERLWRVHDQPAASEVAVGVMGLGVIGSHAADALGASRLQGCGLEPHAQTSFRHRNPFTATAGLDAFLARTEILVCLLPRTRDTEGILNLALVPQAQA